MKIDVKYREGKLEIDSTASDEEREYVDRVKVAVTNFYNTIRDLVEDKRKFGLEGLFDIDFSKKETKKEK